MTTAIEKVKLIAPLVKARQGRIRLKEWAWKEIRRLRDYDPRIRWDESCQSLTYDDVPLDRIKPKGGDRG